MNGGEKSIAQRSRINNREERRNGREKRGRSDVALLTSAARPRYLFRGRIPVRGLTCASAACTCASASQTAALAGEREESGALEGTQAD